MILCFLSKNYMYQLKTLYKKKNEMHMKIKNKTKKLDYLTKRRKNRFDDYGEKID